MATGNRTYIITKNSAAQWTDQNPTLASMEIGVERDSGFFKIGNGIHKWNALPYSITPGSKGLIVFVSEEPDNLLTHGADGGFKLPGEYFNAISSYTAAKGDALAAAPVDLYQQTLFTVGKDIHQILFDIDNLEHRVNLIGTPVSIDDSTVNSTTKTWSALKIVDYMLSTEIDIKNDLLNGNGAAYDTLQSLAAYLATDPELATSIANEMGHMVRHNAAQTLTILQKQTARTNIDALGRDDLGEPVDVLANYTAQLGDSTGSLFIERNI